jgi:hypothetical protein
MGKDAEKKIKLRVNDSFQAVALVKNYLFEDDCLPELIDGKLSVQKVLPHGAMLDNDRVQQLKENFEKVETELNAMADKKGAFKLELKYKEGVDDDSPFGSKSPDKIVFKIEPTK